MSRRPAAVLLIALLCALATPAQVMAQGTSPFQGLPPATPPEQTTTTNAATTDTSDSGIENWQVVLIAAGGFILLAGIGIAIARDARRRAPAVQAAGSSGQRDVDKHHHARQTKQRQRQKQKAARAARRKNR